MVTITTFVEIMVLLTNAIAILNEERLLRHYGLHSTTGPGEWEEGGKGPSVKDNIVGFITAVRTLMRVPLVVINVLFILLEIVAG